jgi:peptidylprolyl isomerase
MKVFFGVLGALAIIAGVVLLFANNSGTSVTNNNATTTLDAYGTATTTATSSASTITNPSNTSGQTNQAKIMQATLHTNKGDITIEFYNSDAPNTVANFIKLAQAGFYDSTKFHRVIKGFMNQGGDPLSKDDSKMALWGTGGPGYQFADEIRSNNRNDIGTISMANAGPGTNGSQFFINVANNNFLDTKHTTFGKVTAGMDVVNAINNVATGANDRPVQPVIINSITLK